MGGGATTLYLLSCLAICTQSALPPGDVLCEPSDRPSSKAASRSRSTLTGGPGFPTPGGPGNPDFPGSPANPSGPTKPGVPWENKRHTAPLNPLA
ncbi:hypothetical protein EYF80_001632 [Liparis tanakae]|uniref:Uncharacterized protein n=1 Tax=Liparis tanakae TaxID=230148 RepID=A0A4Z2JDG2_9TELE|nr:hypothetical protein EYF80_001632 [Liparis tanakae]